MSGWEQITNTLIHFFSPFSRMRWKQWDAKGLLRKSHMEERAIVVLVPLLIISMALDTALFKATASWRALTALPSWCPWSIRPPEKPVQYWEYYSHKERSEVGRLYLKSHGYLKWAVDTPVQKMNIKAIFAVMNSTYAVAVLYYTGIAEVMGSFKSHTGPDFFRPRYFHYCLSSVLHCDYRFHINLFIRSSCIWFSYIYSHLILLL